MATPLHPRNYSVSKSPSFEYVPLFPFVCIVGTWERPELRRREGDWKGKTYAAVLAICPNSPGPCDVGAAPAGAAVAGGGWRGACVVGAA